MPRKKGQVQGLWAAKADAELQALFPQLHEAAAIWASTGNAELLEEAFDAVERAPSPGGWREDLEHLSREEKIVALARQLSLVVSVQGKLYALAANLDSRRETIRAELMALLATPAQVPGFVEAFWRRLQAEGIGQPDLHPVSRGLAAVVAKAIRAYNEERRNELIDDEYKGLPLTDWKELPQRFAGYELVSLRRGEAPDRRPFRLPPFLSIDRYMLGEEANATGRTDPVPPRLLWPKVIREWAARNGRELLDGEEQLWAFLIAYRSAHGPEIDRRFDGIVMRSPWRRGGLVRFRLVPEAGNDLPNFAPLAG